MTRSSASLPHDLLIIKNLHRAKIRPDADRASASKVTNDTVGAQQILRIVARSARMIEPKVYP